MQWALVDSNNVVQNLIVHDPINSTYTPPGGQTLQQVNDWVQIGQAANSAEPAPPAGPTNVQLASQALAKSDTTMLRISEAISLGDTTATTADVVSWVNYRRALRNVINGTSTTLPTKPAYPAGT